MECFGGTPGRRGRYGPIDRVDLVHRGPQPVAFVHFRNAADADCAVAEKAHPEGMQVPCGDGSFGFRGRFEACFRLFRAFSGACFDE